MALTIVAPSLFAGFLPVRVIRQVDVFQVVGHLPGQFAKFKPLNGLLKFPLNFVTPQVSQQLLVDVDVMVVSAYLLKHNNFSAFSHSTVTDLAKFLGWSTLRPRITATS